VGEADGVGAELEGFFAMAEVLAAARKKMSRTVRTST
jgi:hypothetical protein